MGRSARAGTCNDQSCRLGSSSRQLAILQHHAPETPAAATSAIAASRHFYSMVKPSKWYLVSSLNVAVWQRSVRMPWVASWTNPAAQTSKPEELPGVALAGNVCNRTDCVPGASYSRLPCKPPRNGGPELPVSVHAPGPLIRRHRPTFMENCSQPSYRYR